MVVAAAPCLPPEPVGRDRAEASDLGSVMEFELTNNSHQEVRSEGDSAKTWATAAQNATAPQYTPMHPPTLKHPTYVTGDHVKVLNGATRAGLVVFL